MNRARVKQVLEAAAKVPPAKGRALLRGLAAKDARAESNPTANLMEALALAMELAALDALERRIS